MHFEFMSFTQIYLKIALNDYTENWSHGSDGALGGQLTDTRRCKSEQDYGKKRKESYIVPLKGT